MSISARRSPLVIGVLFLALAFVGCSESGSGGNPAEETLGGFARASVNGLSLEAHPETIFIDPADPATPTDPANGGKRYGETTLSVLALDPNGVPQPDLELTFTASSGKLASNGAPVKTDAEGKASDTLRAYEDDPDSIEVSVSDGTRVTTIVVKKVVVAPPVADAGDDQTVECTGNSSADVTLDGTGSSDPNDDIVTWEWFELYGQPDQKLLGTGETLKVSLHLGTHVITLVVTDAAGKTATDEVTIDVVDTTPPKVHVAVSPNRLWPPNHRMVNVHAEVTVDECGPYVVSLESVTSNEPDNGLGDGDTENDIVGVETGTPDYDFQLRAERSGTGSGRVYTIRYRVTDAVGLETFAEAKVRVPHNQGGN